MYLSQFLIAIALGQEQQQRHLVKMEHELTNYDSSMRDGSVDRLTKKTN